MGSPVSSGRTERPGRKGSKQAHPTDGPPDLLARTTGRIRTARVALKVGSRVIGVGVKARLREIDAVLAQGEYLAAYDMVVRELERPGAAEWTDPVTWLRLKYLGGLSLARAGASSPAEALLAEIADTPVGRSDPALAEDVAALSARLVKDRAVRSSAPERAALLTDAASRYEEVYRRLGRTFAGVNAATLWYLAGDHERAADLAQDVLALVRTGGEGSSSTEAYWAAATEAEALLVLGRPDSARRALARAGDVGVVDVGARASTRRQLRLLADEMGLDHHDLLAPIANPIVVHYCGHRMAAPGETGRLLPDEESGVRTHIEDWLAGRTVGAAHGSLASGADIIAAEALLAGGAHLHAVLPCEIDDFIEQSVAPSGTGWVERFRHCMEVASTVSLTCDSAYCGDDTLFAHASRVAIGEALNQARALETDAHQLAVWDGEDPELEAGTAHDVATWAGTGFPTHVVPVGRRSVGRATTSSTTLHREVRAAIFGDLSAFSRLHDEHLPVFVNVVMAAIGRVLDELADHVLFRNTWGDGIFVIADDAPSGAEIGLRIQEALSGLDLERLDLPGDMGMRISGHVGPLLVLPDPVRGGDGYMGRELTRAARIEPRTPPGEVYVTRAFGALLALDSEARIGAEYVGHITTAKQFETVPMYVLRRR